MASENEENMIVGLDIGTSKIVAIVGSIGERGELEIIGTGSYPSSGLKKGVVVNIEATVNSIQRAIEEAELTAAIFAALTLTELSPFAIVKCRSWMWIEFWMPPEQ